MIVLQKTILQSPTDLENDFHERWCNVNEVKQIELHAFAYQNLLTRTSWGSLKYLGDVRDKNQGIEQVDIECVLDSVRMFCKSWRHTLRTKEPYNRKISLYSYKLLVILDKKIRKLNILE